MLRSRVLQKRLVGEALSSLQFLLMPVLLGVTRTVGGEVARSQALARGLLLTGGQRLNGLLAEAARLPLPGKWVAELLARHPSGCEEDEQVFKALLELCFAVVLQWLARRGRKRWALPKHARFTPGCYRTRSAAAPYPSLIPHLLCLSALR